MKCFISVAAIAAVSGLAISIASGQVAYRAIALTGQQALGVPTDVRYTSFGAPVLNSSGQVAFIGSLNGPGVVPGTAGIWAGGSGSLELVALQRSAAPGTPSGVAFSVFTGPVLNDAGHVVFRSTVFGSGVNFDNDGGVWSNGSGSLELIAREGSAAPGVAAGGVFTGFLAPVLDGSGQVAFNATLGGTGVNTSNDRGLWTTSNGSLTLLARRGDAAPGIPTGGVFNGFINPAVNNGGQFAFVGTLVGTGVNSTNNNGIWSGSSGSLALAVRSGQAAPGVPSGIAFSSFSTILGLNNNGQMAFLGNITGTGVNTTNDQGIWSTGSGSLALVTREGNAAPGVVGGVFSAFNNTQVLMNGAGRTAFLGTVSGTGINTTNDTGLWSEGTGSLALVAREGSAAPGVAAGAVFSFFSNPVLNSAGQVAFTGFLTGTGVNLNNDIGLWATDPTGQLMLIAREGDLFDIDPGIGVDNRGIIAINFTAPTGGEDGRGRSFNDDGVLVFGLTFADSTSGIFTATIPGPSSVALLAVGGLMAARRRR